VIATEDRSRRSPTIELIEAVHDADELAIEAVRKFVETVNGILPDVRDDAVRRKIIDSAVNMTERVVDASTEFAGNVATAARDAWAEARADIRLPG